MEDKRLTIILTILLVLEVVQLVGKIIEIVIR